MRKALLATVSAFLAASCGGTQTAEEFAAEADSAQIEFGTNVHKLPMNAGDVAKPIQNTSGPHLNYYGGPVVSNAKAVQVIYGSGTYLSNITSSSTPNVGSFLQSILNSAYVDWLSEYNTPTQHIGRGSFGQKFTVTPASSRNGSTVTDAQIQAELSAQIGAGHLPAPTNNTIYMINFRRGQHITQGGSSSCVAGGFCAYHGTFKRNGQYVFYGVIPDFSPGSGCDVGCGGSTQWGNTTSVTSHELIETITDAAVGLATTYAAPLAWYDPNNGEIGDICNAQQGSINGYVVQKEWSNQLNACIVHK